MNLAYLCTTATVTSVLNRQIAYGKSFTRTRNLRLSKCFKRETHVSGISGRPGPSCDLPSLQYLTTTLFPVVVAEKSTKSHALRTTAHYPKTIIFEYLYNMYAILGTSGIVRCVKFYNTECVTSRYSTS